MRAKKPSSTISLNKKEKVALLSGDGYWRTKAMPKANIPSIMLIDGPHGLRKELERASHIGVGQSHPSTCFPTAVCLAGSWDRNLLKEVGAALAVECLSEGVAVLLGPGINIKRSPLCGRNFEYFSEDPYLTGQLAGAFVKAVEEQGVGTSLKHFAVNNQESWRLLSDAIVDERALREIYLAAFETVVKEAAPTTVMCAYNKVNGSYASENSWLLNSVLRKEWGYKGLVVSDWGAVNNRVEGIKAGLDLEMPGNKGANDKLVLKALKNGELTEEALDQCVSRISAMALSAPKEASKPYNKKAHHELAYKAALESMVLLKNDNATLPIKQGIKLAVIGPFAKQPRYQGAGSSLVNPTQMDKAYDFLSQNYGEALPYEEGFLLDRELPDPVLESKAIELLDSVDMVLLFAGLPDIKEAEGYDRTDMKLPANQNSLISVLGKKAMQAGKKLVVILSNGAPVEMPWIEYVDAVLEAYLPGQAGGRAIADLLLGLASPCGKLAESFPVRLEDNPSAPYFPGNMYQSQYRESIFVGYRYYDTAEVDTLFPFGHGLSYTSFEYSDLKPESSEIRPKESLKLSLLVKNSGNRPGAEIVQLYVHKENSSVPRPVQELKAFEKLYLEAGEAKRVNFVLEPRAFEIYDANSSAWLAEAGHFEIRIASSSQDIRQIGRAHV